MPKTAWEISYFKRSQWARCKGKNDVLQYLASHIGEEQNSSMVKNQNFLDVIKDRSEIFVI